VADDKTAHLLGGNDSGGSRAKTEYCGKSDTGPGEQGAHGYAAWENGENLKKPSPGAKPPDFQQ
jgi:hypothetical protein